MQSSVSSSTVVFVLASMLLASAAYSQPRGSQPQQSNTSHNFYITTPQTGQQEAVGGTANTSAVSNGSYNTYTTTANWQPSTAKSSSSRSESASRATQTSRQTSTASNQTAAQYNTYNNYYTQGAQQTAQQTVYPSYVAHASADTSKERSGFLSRLLHRNSQEKTPQVKQVSNDVRRTRYSGTVQSGTASWYGSDWHGKKTANGERYNMESMTAAHRSLPFGTLVKVRNERNGRECVVRINNRGPFTRGRILDLSKAAARQLGMVSSGVAKIKMEVLGSS